MGQDVSTTESVPKYRQLSRIKRGSFGTVYRVKKRGRKEPTVYALKKIPLVLGTAISARREILSLASMSSHKNVVSMLDHFVEDSMLNVVMELCDIGTLNSYMCIYNTDDGMMTSFMKDMTEGLAHLHKQAIVHGDIKPDNILLCSQGHGYPRCKLADFGLSRFSGDNDPVHLHYLTENRESQYFIAPEVFNHGVVTQQSDVFSLGVVFYAMCTYEGVWIQGMLAPTVDGYTFFWLSTDRHIEERIRCQIKNTQRSSGLVLMLKCLPAERCDISSVSSVFTIEYRPKVSSDPSHVTASKTRKRPADRSDTSNVSSASKIKRLHPEHDEKKSNLLWTATASDFGVVITFLLLMLMGEVINIMQR